MILVLQESDVNITKVIGGVQGSLESTINSVTANTNLINGLSGSIGNLDASFNNLNTAIRSSFVNFAVERFRQEYWPPDQIVAYDRKFADSHNTMSLESGLFSAPVGGTYTFIIANYYCSHDVLFYAVRNQEVLEVFHCYYPGDKGPTRETAAFTMQLNPGDQVGIKSDQPDGPFPTYMTGRINFLGFLLPTF